MNPLSELIREQMHKQRLSYQEVADRGEIAKSTVAALGRGRELTRPPNRATMEALARGLRVPYADVEAAGLASAGMQVPTTERAPVSDVTTSLGRAVFLTAQELDPDERERLALALLRYARE